MLLVGHYRNRETLGKSYFTLGKAFAECNTRQRTLDKLRIEKIKKNSKTFFLIIGTTLQPYLYLPYPFVLSFFTIILNQIYIFYEW
jgi:hypothetical protein